MNGILPYGINSKIVINNNPLNYIISLKINYLMK